MKTEAIGGGGGHSIYSIISVNDMFQILNLFSYSPLIDTAHWRLRQPPPPLLLRSESELKLEQCTGHRVGPGFWVARVKYGKWWRGSGCTCTVRGREGVCRAETRALS